MSGAILEASEEITQLLAAWSDGDPDAGEKLAPLIYKHLHRLARHYMHREQGDHTLQTTALVNEAYLLLVEQKRTDWRNRAHFFAISSSLMRRILVNMARARNRQRRGGDPVHLPLDEALVFSADRAAELVVLDDALEELARLDDRKGRIIEMRFFGGLTVEETAEVLKISPETVMREWKRARAWLQAELAQRPGGTPNQTTP
jgi:RNA polymerase sigma-70 factor (ECF subfamily)